MTDNFDQQKLKSVLDYDPETGFFCWKAEKSNDRTNSRVGKVVGSRASNGYWRIWLFGEERMAHRLAWLWMTGEWPAPGIDIDHKDADRANNIWSNLRLATRSQNNANCKRPSPNKSGLKGVYFHKAAQKWCVQIKKDGRRIYLGLFLSKEDAKAVHDAKALELYGEFARAA